MSLTHAPITQQESERALQEILVEFLGRFFTGSPVTIAGAETTLPACDFFFGQQEVPQPAGKPQIHIVLANRVRKKQANGASDLSRETVTLTHYARSSQSGKAQFESRRVADALLQIYESEHYLLGQVNVRNAKVLRGPTPIPTPLVKTHMLVVTAVLHFATAR